MSKPTRHQNNRHLDQLEKLYEVSTDERYGPIDPDDLAIIEEAEEMMRSGEAGPPPRGPEFFELAIARALEKRGRTTHEIAEKIAAHLADFDEWGRRRHIKTTG